MPINGQLSYAQRYAIDWMRLDAEGRFVRGDPSDVHSYTSYGADVVAVADGTVVAVRNDLRPGPPNLPDPKTITAQTLLGNHVIQDIGHSFFAFYAHLQKGSVTVAPGDRVTRGRGLGKLGNSGNTSTPHLHFHIMAGASAIGSSGLPYVIDSFASLARFRRTPSPGWKAPGPVCSPPRILSSGSSRSTSRSSISRPERQGCAGSRETLVVRLRLHRHET